jgi:hypothetical protein
LTVRESRARNENGIRRLLRKQSSSGRPSRDPVLALLHLVGKVVAAVVLLEGDDDEVLPCPGLRNMLRGCSVFDLDPFLAGVDLALVLRPNSSKPCLPDWNFFE